MHICARLECRLLTTRKSAGFITSIDSVCLSVCHAIQVAVGEYPTLHAHFTALCVIDADLLPMEYLHSTETNFVLTRMHPLHVYLLWTFFGQA